MERYSTKWNDVLVAVGTLRERSLDNEAAIRNSERERG